MVNGVCPRHCLQLDVVVMGTEHGVQACIAHPFSEVEPFLPGIPDGHLVEVPGPLT